MLLQLVAAHSSTPGAALRTIALALVYGAHAVLWALVAALLCRLAAPRASTRSGLWRIALLGPLATAALSTVWPGIVHLTRSALRLESATAVAAFADRSLVTPLLLDDRVASVPRAWASWSPSAEMLSLLAMSLFGCAAVGLIRFAGSLVLLRRVLRERTTVVDPCITTPFEQLRRRAGGRRASLSESCLLASPLVLGRDEVCLPRNFASTFTKGEIEAVLAHELAHLERRDGLWFLLVGLLDALLWMQPLQRWVSARFRRSAELAADDRAVELTHAPLELARALTRMTETALVERRGLLPAMAGQESTRVERVRRLVTQTAEPDAASARTRGPSHTWAVLCVAGAGLVAPNLRAELASANLATGSQPALDGLATASVAPKLSAPTSLLAPSVTEYREELDALDEQAWQLELAISDLHAQRQVSSSDSSMELSLLEQSLRHVHARAAWAKRKLVASHAALERPRGADRSP